jgi:GT2 family glycosyltransferase
LPPSISPAPTSTPGPSLGAAVTSYDSWELAGRCIAALRSWGAGLERIVLVDDHSSEPPPAFPADPRLEVRVNAERRGFAASLNRAVEAAGTELAAVFDADAYPLADASEPIRAAFAADGKLGLLGFRTVDAHGVETPSWSEEPTPFALAAGQRLDGWLRRLRPRRRATSLCLHTAALVFRRRAFLEIGGADEELGFLDVDIDLSMRLRRAGWEVRWEPSLVAFHQGGGSPISTRWRVREYYRSRWRLLRKHGLVRSPRLLRGVVLLRLRLESLLLALAGPLLVRDPARRRDKVEGRRELLRMVREELR